MLTQKIYDVFAASYAEFTNKNVCVRGWDICEQPHQDEMEFICESFKPYCLPPSNESPPSPPKRQNLNLHERSTSAYAFNITSKKPLSRPSTGGAISIRRCKSSKCIHVTGAPSVGPLTKQRIVNGDAANQITSNLTRLTVQSAPDTTTKPTRLSSPFMSMRDITYEFRHYLCHVLHVDDYRKAHTYVLIKKYRELRASGFAGYKLQAALRLNLASSALHRLHNEAAKRLYFESLIGKANPSKEKAKKREFDEKKKVTKTDAHLQCMIETDLPRTLEQPVIKRKSTTSMNLQHALHENCTSAVRTPCILPNERAVEERGCHSAVPLSSTAIYRTLSNFQQPTSAISNKTARVRSFVVDEKFQLGRKHSRPFSPAGSKSRISELDAQRKVSHQASPKTKLDAGKKAQIDRSNADKQAKSKNSVSRTETKQRTASDNRRANISLKPVISKQVCSSSPVKESQQEKLEKSNSAEYLAIASSSHTVVPPFIKKDDDVMEELNPLK